MIDIVRYTFMPYEKENIIDLASNNWKQLKRGGSTSNGKPASEATKLDMIRGRASELAVSKFTNLAWSGFPNRKNWKPEHDEKPEADVGGFIEVRNTPEPWRGVRISNKDTGSMVVATTSPYPPGFVDIYGWIDMQDALSFAPPGNWEWFWVPLSELQSVKTLRDEADVRAGRLVNGFTFMRVEEYQQPMVGAGYTGRNNGDE